MALIYYCENYCFIFNSSSKRSLSFNNSLYSDLSNLLYINNLLKTITVTDSFWECYGYHNDFFLDKNGVKISALKRIIFLIIALHLYSILIVTTVWAECLLLYRTQPKIFSSGNL